MEKQQPKIPALMTLRLTRPTTTTTQTERTPLLQTPGQAPHPHRYGRDGTHQTETRRTVLPTPTTYIKNTYKPAQANTDTPHPPQIVTHPPTVTQTTRTTATHTTTHPPTKKQTPHTTTRPTSTPTPWHTLLPASPPQWAHTRFARPQTTEDRILQTLANMDRHTEPTQTKQTYKKHTGPPPEIIAIIANLQSASTLDDELRAQRERYMTRRAHERTNTDETEAGTSHANHTPHI
ncbi:integumentary mucin A.1-like [Neodiprion fabricii]|uniref:integumentary mucin A.1-like n=1 Tax=Neodiprion fabricii TaxID=2872261 RepID=UPI001ED91F5A|nr:integumentary mucin A.1-like [Neodiprion fabricii]